MTGPSNEKVRSWRSSARSHRIAVASAEEVRKVRPSDATEMDVSLDVCASRYAMQTALRSASSPPAPLESGPPKREPSLGSSHSCSPPCSKPKSSARLDARAAHRAPLRRGGVEKASAGEERPSAVSHRQTVPRQQTDRTRCLRSRAETAPSSSSPSPAADGRAEQSGSSARIGASCAAMLHSGSGSLTCHSDRPPRASPLRNALPRSRVSARALGRLPPIPAGRLRRVGGGSAHMLVAGAWSPST